MRFLFRCFYRERVDRKCGVCTSCWGWRRHVDPLQGGRVPGGLEGAGWAAAGGRMGAVHRGPGGGHLPPVPPGTRPEPSRPRPNRSGFHSNVTKSPASFQMFTSLDDFSGFVRSEPRWPSGRTDRNPETTGQRGLERAEPSRAEPLEPSSAHKSEHLDSQTRPNQHLNGPF